MVYLREGRNGFRLTKKLHTRRLANPLPVGSGALLP